MALTPIKNLGTDSESLRSCTRIRDKDYNSDEDKTNEGEGWERMRQEEEGRKKETRHRKQKEGMKGNEQHEHGAKEKEKNLKMIHKTETNMRSEHHETQRRKKRKKKESVRRRRESKQPCDRAMCQPRIIISSRKTFLRFPRPPTTNDRPQMDLTPRIQPPNLFRASSGAINVASVNPSRHLISKMGNNLI